MMKAFLEREDKDREVGRRIWPDVVERMRFVEESESRASRHAKRSDSGVDGGRGRLRFGRPAKVVMRILTIVAEKK